MQARFSFGKSGIDVAVPDGFKTQVILSHTAQGVDDEAAAISTQRSTRRLGRSR